MNTCPKGHLSQSEDYCDDCGSPMGSRHSSSKTAATPDSAQCPDCQTPRESGARFCEVCQYDFNSGSSSVVSDSHLARSDALARQALASTPNAAPPNATSPATLQAAPSVFEIPLLCRVVSDASLCPDDESRKAFPPQGIDELIFHLDLDENLVGRDSASKNSNPDIPLLDPGASRRHLKIARINGTYCALELGSSNGTLLDGATLVAGKPEPLKEGSVLRLGMWTQIHIQTR